MQKRKELLKEGRKTKIRISNEFYLFFSTTLIIIILDQATKQIAIDALREPVSIINNILSLSIVKNTGAGFGFLDGFKGINSLMIYLSLFIIGLILYFYYKVPNKTSAHISLALILGGGISNFIDRVRLGYVIDFIAPSFWPSFNVADAAITIGVIGFIVFGWRE